MILGHYSLPPISPYFISCHLAHRDLHSFPTRRSSDLRPRSRSSGPRRRSSRPSTRPRRRRSTSPRRPPASEMRSEEHTSELQSQSNLVCRLLLEKKKNTYVTVD